VGDLRHSLLRSRHVGGRLSRGSHLGVFRNGTRASRHGGRGDARHPAPGGLRRRAGRPSPRPHRATPLRLFSRSRLSVTCGRPSGGTSPRGACSRGGCSRGGSSHGRVAPASFT